MSGDDLKLLFVYLWDMRNHKLISLFIFAFLSSSFQLTAQNLDLFNEVAFDSTLIKKHRIKSLTVYSDYTQDGLEESSFSITSKWKEVAFNEEGQPTYVKTIPLFGEFAYLGASDPKWQFFEYDSYHRKSYARTKSEKIDNEEFYTFNKDGKKTKIVTLNNGEPYSTTTFQWKNGQLVDYKSTMADTSLFVVKNSFDTHGNLKRIEYNTVKIDFETKLIGDIKEQHMKSYRDDKLTTEQIIRMNTRRNRFEYFLSLDANKDTLKEVTAQFDQHQNITFYHSKDFSSRQNLPEYVDTPGPKGSNTSKSPRVKNQIPPPFEDIYEIENTYDERGLIIKQKYVEIDPKHPEKKKLISIQRFVYERTALLIQPLPVDEEDLYDYDGNY